MRSSTAAPQLPSRPLAGRVGRRRARRRTGWGDYACSVLAVITIARSSLAAPPTPDPSPPLAEPVLGLAEGKTRGLAGGGEQRAHAQVWALRRGCYPPALWRGGSSEAAKPLSEGWGDYACSVLLIVTNSRSSLAAPPTPDPSPPPRSRLGLPAAGGGEQRAHAQVWALRRPSYPPARWRGGSAAVASRRRTGWGDYACSVPVACSIAASEQAAPPTPDPSPPRASRAGGGERQAHGPEADDELQHSQTRPRRHRDRAQRGHRGDRGDEDQPHAHRLQHDHLRGARLHHRPVHGRRATPCRSASACRASSAAWPTP